MKHPTLTLGILAVFTFIGLIVVGAQITEAQQGTTAATVLRVGNTDIPIIPSTADVRPYFNQMISSPGKQGFVFSSNPGTDFAQMYLLIETNDMDEGDVYVKIGDIYKRMDCETTFGTFASYSLDYSSYAGYSTPVNFDMVVQQECQPNDNEGNFSINSFASILASGKSTIQTPTITNTSPGSAIAPTTTPTTATVSASAPALAEACDLGNGPVQRVAMNADRTSDDDLPEPILATSTGEYALQPRNIIFTDAAGKDQYVLQIWNFSTNEYLAQSVIERGANLKSSFLTLAKETALQAVDNALWWTPIFGIDVDVGQPLDAAANVVNSYDAQFPDKSTAVNTKDISLLPGFGKLAVGTRLCVIENGAPHSYWGKVYFEKDSLLSVPNSVVSLGYTATFLSTQKGTVKVKFGILQSLIPGTTDQIKYTNINASQDAQKSVFRFRLSDDTLNELKGQIQSGVGANEPGETTLANIQEKFTVTLRREADRTDIREELIPRDRMEGALFATPSPPYFSNAQIVEPQTGRPTKIKLDEAVYPGEYTLTLKADGFKPYRQKITITPLMLSSTDTQAVQDGRDVYKLTIKGIKLERDCTATCTTFGTCLACITSSVVSNYKTAETK